MIPHRFEIQEVLPFPLTKFRVIKRSARHVGATHILHLSQNTAIFCYFHFNIADVSKNVVKKDRGDNLVVGFN